ncbi:hypothetical protein [Streptomyces sp. NPDC056304]|uniref:hypothetical protein n=1 Tax=Streptomyces sp. NPDC056304 TaxID=3345778 RepID=UPI0035E0EDE0
MAEGPGFRSFQKATLSLVQVRQNLHELGCQHDLFPFQPAHARPMNQQGESHELEICTPLVGYEVRGFPYHALSCCPHCSGDSLRPDWTSPMVVRFSWVSAATGSAGSRAPAVSTDSRTFLGYPIKAEKEFIGGAD